MLNITRTINKIAYVLDYFYFPRVGSLAADDVISFTVSNYDDDFHEQERDNSWIRR